jgi:peptidoglycan/xylan/chitin deacetylase (PgdA/CDA1 family)
MEFWSLLERAFGWGGVIAYHGVGHYPRLPVMHVSPARLQMQLEALRDRYDIVPLRELVRRWRVGRTTRDCVAITFDDAYAGVLDHALPVLRALDIPATVFVASGHARIGGSYWWDDLQLAMTLMEGGWYEALELLGVNQPESEADVTLDSLRDIVLSRFAGRWPGGVRAGNDASWRSSTFEELTELGAYEGIEFGVHTVSHPVLPLLPYGEQLDEIRNNFMLLRERLPRVLPVVAYPYGLYNATTVRAAAEAGMIAGLTMEGRATSDRPDPMMVPRVGGADIHTPDAIRRKLNRALRPAVVIRNRGRHPRVPPSLASEAAAVPAFAVVE